LQFLLTETATIYINNCLDLIHNIIGHPVPDRSYETGNTSIFSYIL
jgi:hypothetical protein